MQQLDRPRRKSIGTRVSEDQYSALERQAQTKGSSLSRWLHDLLVGQLSTQPAEQILLAEVLALRTILLNVLFSLSSGQRLTEEEIRKLITRADQNKDIKALEKLTALHSSVSASNGSQDGAR